MCRMCPIVRRRSGNATPPNRSGPRVSADAKPDAEPDAEPDASPASKAEPDDVLMSEQEEQEMDDIESPDTMQDENALDDADQESENAAIKVQAQIRGRQARETAAGKAAAQRTGMSQQQWMTGLHRLNAQPLPSLAACSGDEAAATSAFSKMCTETADEVTVESFIVWIRTQEKETSSSVGDLLKLSV